MCHTTWICVQHTDGRSVNPIHVLYYSPYIQHRNHMCGSAVVHGLALYDRMLSFMLQRVLLLLRIPMYITLARPTLQHVSHLATIVASHIVSLNSTSKFSFICVITSTLRAKTSSSNNNKLNPLVYCKDRY